MKKRKGILIPIAAVVSILATASPFSVAGFDCKPLRVTVDGPGYLRLSRDGRAVYAKSTLLTISSSGKIATAEGDALLPTITAPIISQSLEVDLEGNLFAIRGAQKAKIGRLVLALFPEGTILDTRDGVLIASDRPSIGNPGEGENGVIRSHTTNTVATNGASPIKIDTKAPKNDPKPEKATVPVPTQQQIPTLAKTEDQKPVKEAVKTQVEGQQQPAKPKICATSTAEVASEKITLGEIASIEGPPEMLKTLQAIDLGDAPSFGAKRVIDRTRIIGRLQAAGYKEGEIELLIPATVSVTRAGQKISHVEFVEAALKAIQESPGVAIEYIGDSVGPDFLAPMGAKNLVVETVSGINTPVATVKVAVYIGSKRINSRTLTLKAKSMPVAIRSGSQVKVLFKAGGACVEVAGVAKNAGSPGASILVEVRLPGSDKTTHTGLVLPDGSVEVKV